MSSGRKTPGGVDIWPELEESGGALIVEDDVESIASSMRELLDDSEKRSSMSIAARAWVAATFSGDAVANRYIDLYRKAINR